MTHVEQAINEAIEKGGYRTARWTNNESVFLDLLFWQALGKARGWDQIGYDIRTMICTHCDTDIRYQPKKETGCNHVHWPEACKQCSALTLTSPQVWHHFIDHLAKGKDAESFFASL